MLKILPFMVLALLFIGGCSKSGTTPTSTQTTGTTTTTTTTTVAGTVTTLAGSGSEGSVNGTKTLASFTQPTGVAVDANDVLYVADLENFLVREISPYGIVTTLAGSGIDSLANGIGTAAAFGYIPNVAADASGNVFVADQGNHLIRKITPAGVVSTFAGTGTTGSADGTGTAASFYAPTGIAVDGSGNVYVADASSNLIRKITSAGVVTTLAGTGSPGNADGTGTAASFYSPGSLAVDVTGNIYVADLENNRVRKITPAGVVTTLAGSIRGSANGTGTAASFNEPSGVAVDATGNVYVADSNNNLIRMITPAGVVTTLAGSGTAGAVNAVGTAASFNFPTGVAVDSFGNVFVADKGNNLIRKISG